MPFKLRIVHTASDKLKNSTAQQVCCDEERKSLENVQIPVEIKLQTWIQCICIGCNFENADELRDAYLANTDKYDVFHDIRGSHEFSLQPNKADTTDIFTGKKYRIILNKALLLFCIPLCSSGKKREIINQDDCIYIACVREANEQEVSEKLKSVVKKSIDAWRFRKERGNSFLVISFDNKNQLEIKCEGVPPIISKTRYIETIPTELINCFKELPFYGEDISL